MRMLKGIKGTGSSLLLLLLLTSVSLALELGTRRQVSPTAKFEEIPERRRAMKGAM